MALLTLPAGDGTGFSKLAAGASGVTFTNRLSDERSATNRNLLSGSGVAAGDIDGDGWCDLYFCGLDSDNVLYRNLGNWRFVDITREAGVECAGQDSTGAAFADLDGDGDLDLLVTSLGNGLRIFLNDGKGRFTEVTREAGVASRTGGMSMALADIDGDGDLDLFVANYRPTTIRDRPTTTFKMQMVNGQPTVAFVDGRPATAPDLTNRFALSHGGEILEFSEPSDLFLNDGRGRFTRASWTDGRFLDEDGRPLADEPRDWALSVRFYDFTGDGAPDIYVCNDLFSPDQIWVNDGRGRFRAIPRLAVRQTSTFSMGVDFGDLDRDGHTDIYVVDMVSRDLRNRKIQIAGLAPTFAPLGIYDIRPQYFKNTLQLNRGDGTFAEIASYAGLDATEWSWQPVLLDVDLDGYEDVLVPNGMLRDFQNMDMGRKIEAAVASRRVPLTELVAMFRNFPGLILPNLLFRNQGDLTFKEMTGAWGFDSAGVSQGMALADLDNDGDLDLVVNNMNTVAALYRNDSTAPRVQVRLKGRAPNTQGIGARLRVLGGPVIQSQEIVSGGRYLSADDAIRTFAAGALTNRLTLEVDWRSGGRTVVRDVPPNSLWEIDEARAQREPGPAAPPKPPPHFEDVSERIRHVHHEEQAADFAQQPLLPRILSQLGPGASWIDLNQDGHDDLVIATGRGGRVAVYRNLGDGQFSPVSEPPLDAVASRDVTTVLGLPGADGLSLLAGSANLEDGLEQGAMARLYDLPNRRLVDLLPGQRSSTGPLALADVDGDGDLDLFVGGRVVPGRYPEPASSFLFLNDSGRFQVDPRNANRFVNFGLVSSALFADLDGDGRPDLVLACEWGPVRIFRNDAGVFNEVTADWGFAEFPGWWNGVNAVDLDGDGRLDLVAANWGLNTRYRPSTEHPRRIYYGDFLGRGALDIIESCYDPGLEAYAPERDLRVMSMGAPHLVQRYPDHQSYAQATIHELLGEQMAKARAVEATTFSSMLFLNRPGRWEARALPAKAQFSPAFAVCVGDLDGDGHEDVFLSQNFFVNEPFTPRNDAGRGLWLRGDGHGGLTPVPGHESGIQVYGEQRGAALADFNGDGRVDLVVTQNGAETRLFLNRQGRPGLRVRLQGPPGNPQAVGAVIQLQFAQGWGPARNLSAGAGYWSQDSLVPVMALPRPARAIRVRWPGGRVTESALPPEAREIRVNAEGQVVVLR
jgi:enediyne biosynthesis protein E4